MGDLDHLLKAKDDFAFLGLPQEFPLSSVALDQAAAGVANQIASASVDQASQLQQRLSAAKLRLADPVQRAKYLLTLLCGMDGPEAGELPDSVKAFQNQVATAGADPSAVSTLKSAMLSERQARLDHVATVFSFPRDTPNRVSQTSRDSAIWNDLRVIDAIDGLLAKLG
jgi:hypothetical protein